MKKTKIVTMLMASLLWTGVAPAEAQEIEIEPLEIFSGSPEIYPTVWDSTLIFATNKKWDVVRTYFNQQESHMYQLFGVRIKNQRPYGDATPYMGNASRGYNMLTISYDRDGTAYVTQNNMNANVIRGGAPLAVYEYASRDGKAEGRRMENLPVKYNCGMAAVSEDGKTMVFASDARGGEGRIDLYYCTRNGSGWSEPENMGANVNTPGNEQAPYIHPSGKIFFASDGRDDSQGYDIYYTYKTSGGFTDPVKYDEGVNSQHDDYGIYLSGDESWGYVTSDRDGENKIYHFSRSYPTFEECDTLEEMQLCYTLYEESAESYDTTEFAIKWTLGDGATGMGTEVEHCYAGPGVYPIELSVLDKTTGEEMFALAQYELEISVPEQLGIKVPKEIRAGKPVTFGVDIEGIPYFRPKEFYWEFGNGQTRKGSEITIIFDEPGTYSVKCGTIDARNKSDKKCTWTEITVK